MKMGWVFAAFSVMAGGWAMGADAKGGYDERMVEGWKVEVSRDLLEKSELAGKVLRLLEVKLYEVDRVLPPQAVAKLKGRVKIWVELNDGDWPGMCYHPSAQWLQTHGHRPEKAKGVEISNAENFLTWTKQQPFMVLHELAHAYHDQVVGYDFPPIKEAYRKAVEGKKYEKVMYITGRMQRHYALNNDQEYFAEASEAYFGTNDFYPFVRGELKEFDPVGYEAVKKAWEEGQ